MSSLLADEVTVFVVILMICLLAALVIEKFKIPYLHESSFSIIIGVIAALVLKNAFSGNYDLKFDYDLFFTAILPPIIFAAGYTLKKKEFFDNFKYIIVFGVLGTILAFGIITFFAYLICAPDFVLNPEEKLTLSDAMLLACILSSTDTVAALTLVKAEKYPKLNSILFGEGIVNDAVSILLFRTVKTVFDGATSTDVGFSAEIVVTMVIDFLYLSFFSLLIGIGIGLILSLVFKKSDAFYEKPKLETCMVILTGYMSYLMAEHFALSGIISMFSCGLVMSQYTMQNLSEESQKGTVLIFDSFGYLAETFVFIYLGMTIVDFDLTSIHIVFSIGMFIAVAIARFFSVFLPPALYTIFKKDVKLTLKEMKIIWYSGLVRGSIAFALAWIVTSPRSGIIRGTTLFIVLVTVMILANLLQRFAKHIGLGQDIFTEIEEIRSMLLPETSPEGSNVLIQMRSIVDDEKKKEDENNGMLTNKLKNFESKFIQPIFGASSTPRKVNPANH